MHHETSHTKAAHSYQQALAQTVGDFLQHVHMTEIQPDAATVFVHDECNPDSIGQSLPHAHRKLRLTADLIFKKHISQGTALMGRQLLDVSLKATKTTLP